MTKPKLKVIPFNKNDKQKAKIMTEIMNQRFAEYEPVVLEMLAVRNYIEMVYGIQTPDSIWNKLIGVFAKWEISREIVKQGKDS